MRIFLTIFISLCGLCGMAQKTVDSVSIDKEICHFFINGINSCYNVNIRIKNNLNENIWIWFVRNTESALNDSIKIRNHFKRIGYNTDGSLYQWMCDGNVESWISDIPINFCKVIKPNEVFCISFFNADEIEKDRVSDVALNHVNIVPQSEIIKQCPGVDNEYVLRMFTYKSSLIAIPWLMFVDFIKERQ